MKTNKLVKMAVLVTLLATAAMTRADVTVGTFSGSAIGNGLDLQGSFVYALTMNSSAVGTILDDTRFTDARNTQGVTVASEVYIQDWYHSSYTGSPNDIALGSVMKSISSSFANGQPDSQVFTMTMAGLTIGQSYKAQFLFAEVCCDRGFNFYHSGEKLASNFSPYALTGNRAYNSGESAVLIDTFTATSDAVVFGFGGSANHSDNNPILNAATLESMTPPVPEPETYTLLLAGLSALGLVSRRRKSE